MFFIRCGGLISWLLVLLGLLHTAAGVFVTFSTSDIEMPAAVASHLASVTSGDAIIEGVMVFAAGIVMGLLVQIAKGVRFD